MSSTNSSATSHSRSASTTVGGAPISFSTRGINMNDMGGTNGGGRVYAHLDDLVAVRPNVDINSPMRKILQDGELLAKQADTHLDFRRPDIALQEYIKASIVAVEIIPRHKEYVTLQSSKGELNRMYAALNKRINAQHSKFAEVKLIIKENNARSGVKPVGTSPVAVHKPNGSNGHVRAQSVQHTPLNALSNSSASPRPKPPVQPKPNALHGNAIVPPNQSDLAARFAGLRSGGSNGVVQDPRIRTQSISIPTPSSSTAKPSYSSINRPTGPREMPSVPTTLPSRPPLDVNIPSFPRAPDAIYSPAQNADTPASANLLSSVPRSGSYVGTSRAAPPISTHVPTPKIQEERKEYFIPAYNHPMSTNVPKRQPPPSIPDSTTVTAEDLVTYLGYGSQTLKLLIVDVRSRDDFEVGHILAPTIICVEPITIRPGISAEQLGDSMVINPDSEQALYEHRHDFDLIVFYDQSSSILSSSGDDILLHFSKAVWEYDYEKRLKRRPMLLVGGLDAWTDLLGPASLKATISRTSSPAPDTLASKKHARPLGRFPLARRPPAVPLKRRKTHSSRPLTKEEEDVWDQTLKADSDLWKTNEAERASNAELVYAKTTEDFFRRYPELPAIQESMISPMPAEPRMDRPTVPSIPLPPARPAPALPRQRSSGLSERGAPVMVAAHNSGITAPLVAYGLTGLTNENGVTCYMNSAVQAISATPFLRELLLNFNRQNHIVPKKDEERSNPPQLMVRSFNILMSHLWSGQYNYLTPHSFGKYVNSVHAGALTDQRIRDCAYAGSKRQHDSAEFLNFLIEIIDDELNPRRDRPSINVEDPAYEKAIKEKGIQAAATYAWNAQMSKEDSPITRKMKGLIVRITTCGNCKGEVRRFELFTYLTLPLAEANWDANREYTLAELFQANYGQSETIDHYTCDSICKKPGQRATRVNLLCYVPDYLVVQLGRYNSNLEKLTNTVTFPEKDLNIDIACLPANEVGPVADRRLKGPFFYDTYAVTMHRGNGIKSGHYMTYAKSLDKPSHVGGGPAAGKWHWFNDRTITPADFEATQAKNGGPQGIATVIFLKRRGAPDL